MPSFWKLLLLWDGDRMQVSSQHPREADMDPGRGGRVSMLVCPGLGTAALLVHGSICKKVYSAQRDTCSRRGRRGTLCDCMTPAPVL